MNTEKQKKLYSTALWVIIIFAVVYIIVNVPIISSFVSGLIKILAPILIGASIAYILNPILKIYEYKIFRKLKNKNARRSLSIILTYLTALALIVAFLWLVIPQLIDSLMDLTSQFGEYITTTTDLINSLINKLSQNPEFVTYFDEEMFMEFVTNFFQTSDTIFKTALDYLTRFGSQVITGIKDAILGIFISIYMLISKERLHAQTRRLTAALFKEKTRNHLLRYTRIANRTFGGFFIGMIFDAIIVAVVTFILLTIFNVPYASLVSVIVGCTNIIPIFGPFIGAIPSAFIIFVKDPFKALVFVILIIVIQQIDGNVIAPKLLGTSTGISSLGVIVAIIIMGAYFGVLGMIIGVPVFAMIITVCNEFIETKLKTKGLPTQTADYYPAYSLVDPNESHEKVGERLFHSIENSFKNFIKLFKNKKKKRKIKEENEATEEKENNESNDKRDS